MSRSNLIGMGMWCVVGFVSIVMLNRMPATSQQVLYPSGQLDAVSVDKGAFSSIFMEAKAKQPTSSSAASEVTLLGVIFDKNGNQSKALLKVGNDQAKAYALNAKLPNSDILKKITPRSIELVQSGEIVELTLPKVK